MAEHPEKTRLLNKDKVRELRYLKKAGFHRKRKEVPRTAKEAVRRVCRAGHGWICLLSFWGCFSFDLFLLTCMGVPAFLYMSMSMQVPNEAREKGEIV